MSQKKFKEWRKRQEELENEIGFEAYTILRGALVLNVNNVLLARLSDDDNKNFKPLFPVAQAYEMPQ